MSLITKRFSSPLITTIKNNSKSDFENELRKNQILWNLWNLPPLKPLSEKESNINAISTLPIVYRTKAAVFHEVSNKNPDKTGISLQLKQYTEYAKSIIHFYRVGITNVWKNRKVVSEIKKRYHIETVDNHGKVIQRRFSNGNDLLSVLKSLETLTTIEQDALKKIDHNLLLNITRKEFLTVLRTEQDFYKLPMFALILLIFAESTPLLCFVFPEITPSTCVFPSLLKKINKSSIKSIEELNKLRLERYNEEYYSKGKYPSQNVWKLPIDELRLLITSLNLKSKYLPVWIYPESILRQRLLLKFDQLKVDDYFLTNSSNQSKDDDLKENFWSLSKNELIRSCIDRGLIDFTKDDLIHIGNHELKIRLFFYLGLSSNDKNIGNVGVIGLNHLNIKDNSIHFDNIDQETAHKIHQWWINKHE